MKTIIEMAQQADIDWHRHWNDDGTNHLERLVELARADEREAIDQLVNDDKDLSDSDAIRISKAIRARGNK